MCYNLIRRGEYMFNKYKIFLDYDGVLLDSEELIIKYHKESNKSWDDFFEQVNWLEVYQNSNEINDSFCSSFVTAISSIQIVTITISLLYESGLFVCIEV